MMMTYNPKLFDNLFISSSHSRFIDSYSMSKETSREYDAVSYGVADCYYSSSRCMDIIFSDFLDDFEEAILNYWKGYMLCDICDSQEKLILYKLIVEKKKQVEIGRDLNFDRRLVHWIIRKIHNKYKKMEGRKK